MGLSTKALSILFLFSAFFVVCLFSIQLYFPCKYCDDVKAYAEIYEVPEELVYATIHTESKFDANAVSAKGAIGLMQILPSTGAWIAEQIAYDTYEKEDLYNPQINIQFGCYYLSYLLNKFESEALAICAYNAGEGEVVKWLQNETFNTNSIPYKETKNYLKRVQFAEKIYNLY